MSHFINHQFIHLLWATKNLNPLIFSDSKAPLLAYITGILKGLNGLLIASSATADHIHLLAKTPTDISVAELLRQIKACSSKWYREQYSQHLAFGWNEGYSAFTVSTDSIERAKKIYIS